VFDRVIVGYPLIPWLSVMIFGWVFGRWLLSGGEGRAGPVGLWGGALLGLFVVVRGFDRYGNWGLHRDSGALLQWLHVAKYPPSLAYVCLELGLGLILLALFIRLENSGRSFGLLTPLSLFGSTAFFYYLLHVHVMSAFQAVTQIDRHSDGLAKTWIGAGVTLATLAPLCWLYRRYKAAHPNGWARYI
jgi:uncharacterized membrane protein